MSKTYAELSPDKFDEYTAERDKAIEMASNKALPEDFPVNILAKKLHPDRQYMIIDRITELPDRTKSFCLVPDPERGTTQCAHFLAGQYLNVFLNIYGASISRAYSISSSPEAAKEGYYTLTVKYVEDGLASRYMIDNWKAGDKVEVSGPAGHFYYSPIRDAKNVIGIAGGSGITPFLSMARAIAAGKEDFNLTVLYGSRKEEFILFKDEFDELAKKCEKIKVVHVLSDEEKEGFEHGFITAELIEKYASKKDMYSIFLCGPQAMYNFVDKEIDKLNIAQKFVRHELFGEVHNAAAQPDYPGCSLHNVKITVSIRDEVRTVLGSVNDTIMQTLEKNGISVPASCRSGECGFCHSMLRSGQIYVPKAVDGRRLADFKFGGIHPCVAFPLTDIEIEVPYAK